MDSRMFADYAEFAAEISREAGNILLRGFRSDTTVISYKSRTDLVTSVDRESEDYLFAAVRKRFPHHTVIAEEGSKSQGDEGYIWYIDPLDATNNFAHGIAHFCVSIGIYSAETCSMAAGVVYDPCRNELFRAVRGEGAFLNGGYINVSSINDIGISLLATGFPYSKSDCKKNNLQEFNQVLPNVQGIRRMGSAALDLCYLACGRFDGYWEPGLKSWDMAAGSLIVEEAGGAVTRFNGDAFSPEIPEIIATNGHIHAALQELIAKKQPIENSRL